MGVGESGTGIGFLKSRWGKRPVSAIRFLFGGLGGGVFGLFIESVGDNATKWLWLCSVIWFASGKSSWEAYEILSMSFTNAYELKKRTSRRRRRWVPHKAKTVKLGIGCCGTSEKGNIWKEIRGLPTSIGAFKCIEVVALGLEYPKSGFIDSDRIEAFDDTERNDTFEDAYVEAYLSAPDKSPLGPIDPIETLDDTECNEIFEDAFNPSAQGFIVRIEAFDDTECNDDAYLDGPLSAHKPFPSPVVAPSSWAKNAAVSLWYLVDFISHTVGKFSLVYWVSRGWYCI